MLNLRQNQTEIYFKQLITHSSANNYSSLAAEINKIPLGYLDPVFLMAVKKGSLYLVKELTKHPKINPARDHSRSLREAALGGNVETVDFLLQFKEVEPIANDCWAIRAAAKESERYLHNRLLEKHQGCAMNELTTLNFDTEDWITENRHLQVVARLLRTGIEQFQILEKKCPETFKLLIKFANPVIYQIPVLVLNDLPNEVMNLIRTYYLQLSPFEQAANLLYIHNQNKEKCKPVQSAADRNHTINISIKCKNNP